MADINLESASQGVEAVEIREQLTTLAAEDISAGDLVALNGAGKFLKADADAGAPRNDPYGVALLSCKSGQPLTAVRSGVIAGFDLSGLAFSAKVYMSNTTGKLADAAGAVSFVVGRVIPGTGTPPNAGGNFTDKLLNVEMKNI